MEKEESDQIQKSVLRLRRGFIFSLGTLITLLILWILNVICCSLSIFYVSPFYHFLLYPLALLYVLGFYNRASAWERINEHNVSILLSVGGSIILTSPYWLLCLWIISVNYLAIYLAIPLAIWLIYTVFELCALKALEKNYELNLKKARICIIAGVIIATASLIFLLMLHIPGFLHLEYRKIIAIFSSLFTLIYIYPYPNLPIPFLITSCILIIRELTRKIKTTC